MRVAYITYWPFNDVLSTGSSQINLKILAEIDKVLEIDYYTVERNISAHKVKQGIDFNRKITHRPIVIPKKTFISRKLYEYVKTILCLAYWAIIRRYDVIICRSCFSGFFGMLIKYICGGKLIVESFEPHSKYMLNSPDGWSNKSIRYLFLSTVEKYIIKHADVIMPLTNNYKKILQNNAKKVVIQPCSTAFKGEYLLSNKNDIRLVYLGKFGGIYYDIQAFKFLAELLSLSDNLIISIYTTQSIEYIKNKIKEYFENTSRVIISRASHTEVEDILKRHDFGINFHRSSEYSICFSPIKNAEYWSCGLPIIIGEKIGDDSMYINNNSKLGIVVDYDSKNLRDEAAKVLDWINSSKRDRRNECITHFNKYRGLETIKASYYQVL